MRSCALAFQNLGTLMPRKRKCSLTVIAGNCGQPGDTGCSHLERSADKNISYDGTNANQIPHHLNSQVEKNKMILSADKPATIPSLDGDTAMMETVFDLYNILLLEGGRNTDGHKPWDMHKNQSKIVDASHGTGKELPVSTLANFFDDCDIECPQQSRKKLRRSISNIDDNCLSLTDGC